MKYSNKYKIIQAIIVLMINLASIWKQIFMEKLTNAFKMNGFICFQFQLSIVFFSKSTEEISGDLLFDFISKSIESRFPLFSFLNYNSLSDEKFSELIDLHGQNQHYFQYLPPNLMYWKSIKDENKVIKNQLDELNKKCHKYNEFFDDAFKFAELMVLSDSCSLEVIRFLELCSERGNVLAHLVITFLAFCSGSEEGKKLAFPYLQKSYEEGNKYALCIFGFFYEKGFGVEMDYSKAFDYYKQSAENGDPFGYIKLASMYRCGNGVEKDIQKAIEFYQKAVELGNSTSSLILAGIYESGKEVKQESTKAIEYYKKSADLGNYNALERLGEIYEKGEIVEKNLTLALEYYEKASKNIFCGSIIHDKIKTIKELQQSTQSEEKEKDKEET